MLYGNDGDDLILGGRHNDQLFGNAGNDVLIGGVGDDVLTGGTGDDSFIFRSGDGVNRIRDFTLDDDLIGLRSVSAISDFDDLLANHVTQSGADLIITDGINLSITVENTSLTDVTAEHFLF